MLFVRCFTHKLWTSTGLPATTLFSPRLDPIIIIIAMTSSHINSLRRLGIGPEMGWL